MSISRKENGSLVKKAGRALVDLALSLTSHNAVANSAVSTKFQQVDTEITQVKDSLDYRTVIVNGVSTTSATVHVDISRIRFSANHPIFLYGAYRTESASNNDGFCILKNYNNKIFICQKVGLGNFGEVSMDSSATTLTITCGAYMSLIVIGYPKNN